MLRTINKHRQAHRRASDRHFHIADSRCCSTWATYHPNPPKDTLLFLLSMVPLYSRLTPIRLPLPPHCLSCIVTLSLCFSISQSLFVSSLSRVHLSLKWFHSPPSFSPFVYVCDSLGFSHLLCHSLSLQRTTPHMLRVEEWVEEEERRGWMKYLFIYF